MFIYINNESLQFDGVSYKCVTKISKKIYPPILLTYVKFIYDLNSNMFVITI